MTKPSAAALHRPVLESNRIALGTWTIGGPWTRRGQSSGLGQADEGESIAALHSGFDGGITFIDTADVYGCGRAETIIGKALGKHRDEIEIATKFGTMFDEHRREAGERCVTPAFIRRSCEASLRRLNTDRIDLYQLHWAACPVEYLDDVVGTLEGLRTEGKIVSFGFSTDDPSQAAGLVSSHQRRVAAHLQPARAQRSSDLPRRCGAERELLPVALGNWCSCRLKNPSRWRCPTAMAV